MPATINRRFILRRRPLGDFDQDVRERVGVVVIGKPIVGIGEPGT